MSLLPCPKCCYKSFLCARPPQSLHWRISPQGGSDHRASSWSGSRVVLVWRRAIANGYELHDVTLAIQSDTKPWNLQENIKQSKSLLEHASRVTSLWYLQPKLIYAAMACKLLKWSSLLGPICVQKLPQKNCCSFPVMAMNLDGDIWWS